MSMKDNTRSLGSSRLKKIFSSFSFPFEIGLAANDYWAMLFIGCVSLYVHKLLWVLPLYLLLKTNRRMGVKVVKEQPSELEQVVLFIQMNRLQSLTEAIESNPLLLHSDYKKRSLATWCKFHNNTKALMVINQLNAKYPPEKVEAMAA